MKKQLNLRDAIHSFSFLSFHWKETNLKSLMRVKTYAFCDIFFICGLEGFLSHTWTNGNTVK